MESNKPTTPIQRIMQIRGVSIRELAGLSGESTALICYITRGLARFPTYEQLERCAKYMGCAPYDLYTKAELRMFYPEQFPKRKRERYGNPRVRIDHEDYAYLANKYGDPRRPDELIRFLVHNAVQQEKEIVVRIIGNLESAPLPTIDLAAEAKHDAEG